MILGLGVPLVLGFTSELIGKGYIAARWPKYLQQYARGVSSNSLQVHLHTN